MLGDSFEADPLVRGRGRVERRAGFHTWVSAALGLGWGLLGREIVTASAHELVVQRMAGP